MGLIPSWSSVPDAIPALRPPALTLLLRLNTSFLDDVDPFVGFGNEEFRQLFRRRGGYRGALLAEAVEHRRILAGGDDLLVEPGDDLLRRAFGRKQREPARRDELRQTGLRGGRHVRQRGEPCPA